MSKNNSTNYFKTRRTYLAVCFCLPLVFITCHEQEKKAQRNDLDNKISTLDKKIQETQDLRTAKMPAHLHNTQSRYINAADSLDKKADTVGICMMENEDLLLLAFNNYAVRIGQNFQMSDFLSKNDITTLQQHIAQFDSVDFVQDMARERILHNNGSLNDLSYFLELLDFDSINSKLDNKLAWNFYTDSTNIDSEEPVETSVLNFEKPELNQALITEQNLLKRAWKRNTLQEELNKTDSLQNIDMANAIDSATQTQIASKYDSLKTQMVKTFTEMPEYVPNFNIPEFESVRKQYLHNDSVINNYNETFFDMSKAEDSLEQYRQSIIRQRDSLVEKRNELTR